MKRLKLGFIALAAGWCSIVSTGAAIGDTGPVLTVSGSHVPTFTTCTLDTPATVIQVPPDTDIVFCWSATPGAGGSALATHRWGWNILDPDDPDDAGWQIPAEAFGGAESCSTPRSFTTGTVEFIVQVTDVNGVTSRARVRAQITPNVDREDLSWSRVKSAY